MNGRISETEKQMMELSKDITAVTFSITVSDVKTLENEFNSREIYIRGFHGI